MADLARSHAVVIGAGMAGLTAAQAISGHFGKVTIIERDVLPAGAAPRSGTPQAQHAHMLLAGGLKALQSLFPGFENDLAEAGAVKIRTGKDIRYERPGSILSRFAISEFTFSACHARCSKPLPDDAFSRPQTSTSACAPA
jgi:2-polyprenyl-6-methoxyphenol hydroxylase-like FAD-dependent oxidoreductase